MMKTKLIARTKNINNTEYISFFKSYFDRLSKEHPKWSAHQITSIIRLLWMKRKVTDSRPARLMKLAKPMSGRMTFMRSKRMQGLNPCEMMKNWRRLPLESRRLWEMRGKPAETRQTMEIRGTIMLTGRGAMEMEPMRNLGFMNMRMM
jgi:hypothetical protein